MEQEPKATLSDNGVLTVTLFRNGKEEVTVFGRNLVVTINRTDEVTVMRQLKIRRMSWQSKFAYFLYATPGWHATPEDFRVLRPFGVQISEAESVVFQKLFGQMGKPV